MRLSLMVIAWVLANGVAAGEVADGPPDRAVGVRARAEAASAFRRFGAKPVPLVRELNRLGLKYQVQGLPILAESFLGAGYQEAARGREKPLEARLLENYLALIQEYRNENQAAIREGRKPEVWFFLGGDKAIQARTSAIWKELESKERRAAWDARMDNAEDALGLAAQIKSRRREHEERAHAHLAAAAEIARGFAPPDERRVRSLVRLAESGVGDIKECQQAVDALQRVPPAAVRKYQARALAGLAGSAAQAKDMAAAERSLLLLLALPDPSVSRLANDALARADVRWLSSNDLKTYEQLCRKVLQRSESQLLPKDFQIARGLTNLAQALLYLRQPAELDNCLQRAAQILESAPRGNLRDNLAPRRMALAEALERIAALYSERDPNSRPARARSAELRQRALEIRWEQDNAGELPDLVLRLADDLLFLEKKAEALGWLKRLHARLGDLPDVSLAQRYARAGDCELARRAYLRTLAVGNFEDLPVPASMVREEIQEAIDDLACPGTWPPGAKPVPALECPAGTNPAGKPWPEGTEQFCSGGYGVKSGPYRSWYGNGEPKQEGGYHDDQKVGRWKTWYGNGQPMMEGHYASGLHEGYTSMDGPWTFWERDGRKAISCTFQAGLLQGPLIRWLAGGRLQQEATFHDDRPDGRWKNVLDGHLASEGELCPSGELA